MLRRVSVCTYGHKSRWHPLLDNPLDQDCFGGGVVGAFPHHVFDVCVVGGLTFLGAGLALACIKRTYMVTP